MVRIQKVIGFSILFSCAQVWAQRTDTLQLVTINGSRFSKFTSGSNQYTIDSTLMVAYRTQQLAQLLTAESQIHMKAYGPSGLTSTSFRGASAEHTAIVWKGFNLQSPLNGQVDFTQIPIEITDRIAVQYGGNGALFGSGAIGGSIRLESTPSFNQPTKSKINIAIGSFGYQRYSASCDWGQKQKRFKILAYHEQVQNDFTFTNTSMPNSPEQQMRQANAQQTGIVSENTIQVANKHVISFALWYHQAKRQLALPMSVTGKSGQQEDNSIKATIDWTRSFNKWVLMARTAFFYDQLDYRNPIDIFSGYSKSFSQISEVEGRFSIQKKHQINIGINQTNIWAESDGFGGRFSQLRTAIFASYKTFTLKQKLQFTFNIREELVSNTITPVMPYLGLEYTFKWGIKLLGNANRSYRLPTFNELFWKTAQNQKILPESGWGAEIGLAHTTPANSKLRIETKLTYFERIINNWIIWQPIAAGNGWAPRNLRQVYTKGGEFKIAGSYPITPTFQLTGQSQFSALRSTVSKSELIDDEAQGKQLIYVPRLTHQHRIMAHYKKSHIGYLHAYTGLRFTASDNSNWLNDYQIGSLIVGHSQPFKSISILVQFQLQNCWNATYVVIADRPMPGRNYRFNFQLQF